MIIIGKGVLRDEIYDTVSFTILGVGMDRRKMKSPIVRPMIPGLIMSFLGVIYFLSPLIRVMP